ncbi:MAG: M3 family metallopeptidase, partial [Candidatus Malihini olakiniferum]
MTNPLLIPFTLPPFSAMHADDIVPAVQSVLADCRNKVDCVVAQKAPFTWENLCQRLAESDDRLSRLFSL